MSSPPATAPFQDLVEESFDEAAFLWRRWEQELTSLTRNLDEVWSWTEDRLHGALDGVHAGGTAGIALAVDALQSDDIGRVTAAAGVLASSAAPEATEAIAHSLRGAHGARLQALLRGLEVAGSKPALRAAAGVLAANGPESAAALCRLKAFWRSVPGDELTTALQSGVPDVQAAAMRAASHAPLSRALETWIASSMRSDSPDVRYAGVETGLCLGFPRAHDAAASFASQPGPDAGRYLKLMALLGRPGDHECVFTALRIPELQMPAIWALGHIGTARAADACVAGMQHEPLARACGEAYCWITGADLGRDGLAAEERPADAPAFEDDDLEADLVPPPEALWPLPDPDAVRRHWLALKSGWTADVRYLQGRPATGDTLVTTIETGPMLRRPDLVLELRIRTQGRYDVETRAFATRQRAMMAKGRSAAAEHRG